MLLNKWSGLWWGPLGLIVSGIMYGPDADRIREEKEKLIGRREIVSERLKFLSPTQGRFLGIQEIFTRLDEMLFEVGLSADALKSLWGLLNANAKESQQSLGKIRDDVGLGMFVYRFRRVVEPWEAIGQRTREMTELFEDVAREIKREF